MVAGVSSVREVASWYTPGAIDGFGDRLVMFDNTDSQPLEVLRFRAEISEVPGFEPALRERFAQLRDFTYPGFASVRAVKRLESDGTLALISTHTPGKPLSTFLHDVPTGKALPLPFVIAVVKQGMDALAAL